MNALFAQRAPARALRNGPPKASGLRAFSNEFREGDIVVLRPTYTLPTTRSSSSFLSPPLSAEPGRTIRPQNILKAVRGLGGSIKQADLLGKAAPALISTSHGASFIATWPTLAEHILLSKRLVTPVYPADAAAIVNMLDVHVDPYAQDAPPAENEPPFRIMEAGTGHGSLTLHLARAVHAANKHIPADQIPNVEDELLYEDELLAAKHEQQPAPEATEGEPAVKKELSEDARSVLERFASYKRDSRRAVIHSLDISRGHQKGARKVVRRFRRGLYYPHVDFSLSDPSAFLAARQEADPAFRIDAAVLDIPSPELHLEATVGALRPDGRLVVFAPSVTQIAECIRLVREARIPAVCESVIELEPTVVDSGPSSSIGGREWDVRIAVPRKSQRKEKESESAAEEAVPDAHPELEANQPDPSAKSKDVWVCRPRSGTRIAGGGFVGVWCRKMSP